MRVGMSAPPSLSSWCDDDDGDRCSGLGEWRGIAWGFAEGRSLRTGAGRVAIPIRARLAGTSTSCRPVTVRDDAEEFDAAARAPARAIWGAVGSSVNTVRIAPSDMLARTSVDCVEQFPRVRGPARRGTRRRRRRRRPVSAGRRWPPRPAAPRRTAAAVVVDGRRCAGGSGPLGLAIARSCGTGGGAVLGARWGSCGGRRRLVSGRERRRRPARRDRDRAVPRA